jgi:acyl-CoA thioester hydrolase
MSRIVETKVRVRYAETDQMGVAYYANFFVWFEIGRTEYCRQNGVTYRDMELEDDAYIVVAEATCRYKVPARYDDLLRICTSVKKARKRVIVFGYEVYNDASGELLATGTTTHVITGRDGRPKSLPKKYHKVFLAG